MRFVYSIIVFFALNVSSTVYAQNVEVQGSEKPTELVDFRPPIGNNFETKGFASQGEVLHKYLNYKYRFKRRFLYPFSKDISDGVSTEILDPSLPGHYIPSNYINHRGETEDYGDATIYLGMYLGVLATEYRLLQINDDDNSETLKEIIDILATINRLDEAAEKEFGEDDGVLNGFFLRHDEEGFNYTKPNEPEYDAMDGNVTSQDQVWHLYQGLALTKKFVNTPFVQHEVIAISQRLFDILHYTGDNGREKWKIKNPVTDVVPAEKWGPSTWYYAYGYNASAKYLTGHNQTLDFQIDDARAKFLIYQAAMSDFVTNYFLDENDVMTFDYEIDLIDGNKYSAIGLFNLVAVGNTPRFDINFGLDIIPSNLVDGDITLNDLLGIFGQDYTVQESAQHYLKGFAEMGYSEQSVLVNYLLHDGDFDDLPDESLYIDLLIAAPDKGPMLCFDNLEPRTQFLLDCYEDALDDNCSEEWSSLNRYFMPDAKNRVAYYGGLDFMLLHNLYRLVYSPNELPCKRVVSHYLPYSEALNDGSGEYFEMGTHTSTQYEYAYCSVESYKKIKSDGSGVFVAGESISLLPGFSVEHGGLFRAELAPNINVYALDEGASTRDYWYPLPPNQSECLNGFNTYCMNPYAVLVDSKEHWRGMEVLSPDSKITYWLAGVDGYSAEIYDFETGSLVKSNSATLNQTGTELVNVLDVHGVKPLLDGISKMGVFVLKVWGQESNSTPMCQIVITENILIRPSATKSLETETDILSSKNNLEQTGAIPQIFPNPSSGAFKIIVPKEFAPASVVIYGSCGNRVHSSVLEMGVHDIQLNATAGIYTVKIAGFNSTLTEKLIIY